MLPRLFLCVRILSLISASGLASRPQRTRSRPMVPSSVRGQPHVLWCSRARLVGSDLECKASESKICNGERLGWPAHSKIHLCPSQRTLRVGATRHSSPSPCRFRCRPLNSQHRSFPGEPQPARKTMTHDWMMRCAGQFGGSRDAALVCPHRGPSCGSRVPRPNGRAVCRAARCCAALCGIAKPAPRCFQDPSWIPVQKQKENIILRNP